MAVTAAQKNVSDGNLAVCDSIDFAICPSVCSRHTADAIAMCQSPAALPRRTSQTGWSGDLRFYQHAFYQHAGQWTRFRSCRFRLRNLSRGDCEQRSNDLETTRHANDFTAVTRELFRRASEATAREWLVEEAIRLLSPRWRSMVRCRCCGTHGGGRNRSTSSHRTRARAPGRRCARSTCP
jgi:hypothetical protein